MVKSNVDMELRSSAILRSVCVGAKPDDLLAVTGEPGDVTRHPDLSYGDSALTFRDVTCSVKVRGKDKVILAPMSGHFEPGSLVAVMGPSGCGKTTLIDILAARKTETMYGGTVLVNGYPRNHLFPRMTAYVPQLDVMPAHLTVKEVVAFSQQLKQELPSEVTRETVDQLTEARLEAVGLTEVRNMWIGSSSVRGISGGQKRRVSIARGLAAEAQIIFCDEPTSGLSATDAEACVKFMRLLAHKFGVTIICAIHQPRIEVARLFDHLFLLASNPGRVVYNGWMRDAVQHWQNAGFPVPRRINPTDYYLDLVTPGRPQAQVDALVQHYEAHCMPAVDQVVEAELVQERAGPIDILEARRKRLLQFGHMPPVRNSRYAVSFGKQLRLVFARQLTLNLRDKERLIADLGVAVAKAVVLGVTYLRIGFRDPFSQLNFFFMLLMAVTIDGMKGMPMVIAERTVMKIETSQALYNEFAYIISFKTIQWIQALVSHTIFVLILFGIAEIQWDLFPVIFLWTTLLYLTMDSLYQMIAAIAKDTATAQLLSVPFLLLFLLYNGYTVSRATIPPFMSWALWFSPVAYAMESISIAAFHIEGGPDWARTVKEFQYVEQPICALSVTCMWLVLFCIVQLVCLKCFNDITR